MSLGQSPTTKPRLVQVQHTKKSLLSCCGAQKCLEEFRRLTENVTIINGNKPEKGTLRCLCGTAIADVLKGNTIAHALEASAAYSDVRFGLLLKAQPIDLQEYYSRVKGLLQKGHLPCIADLSRCDSQFSDRMEVFYDVVGEFVDEATHHNVDWRDIWQKNRRSLQTLHMKYSVDGYNIQMKQRYGTVTGSSYTKVVNSLIVGACLEFIYLAIEYMRTHTGLTFGLKSDEDPFSSRAIVGDDIAVTCTTSQVLAVLTKGFEAVNLNVKAVQSPGSTRVVFLQMHVTDVGWFRQAVRMISSYSFNREPFLVEPKLTEFAARMESMARKLVERGASQASYLITTQMTADMYLQGSTFAARTNKMNNGLGIFYPDNCCHYKISDSKLQEVSNVPELANESKSLFKTVGEYLSQLDSTLFHKLGLHMFPEFEQSCYREALSTMRSPRFNMNTVNKELLSKYLHGVSAGAVDVNPTMPLHQELVARVCEGWYHWYAGLLDGTVGVSEFNSRLFACPLFHVDTVAKELGFPSLNHLDMTIKHYNKVILDTEVLSASRYLLILRHFYDKLINVNDENVCHMRGYRSILQILECSTVKNMTNVSQFLEAITTDMPGDSKSKFRFKGAQGFREVLKSGGCTAPPWLEENARSCVQRIAIHCTWQIISGQAGQFDFCYDRLSLDNHRPLHVFSLLIRSALLYMTTNWKRALYNQGAIMYSASVGALRPKVPVANTSTNLLLNRRSLVLKQCGVVECQGQYSATIDPRILNGSDTGFSGRVLELNDFHDVQPVKIPKIDIRESRRINLRNVDGLITMAPIINKIM